MEKLIDNLKIIAEKPLKYSRDINQHIISCRNAIHIIETKEHQYISLQKELESRDNYHEDLLEKIKMLEKEIKTLKEKLKIDKEIIMEAYKIINELTNK